MTNEKTTAEIVAEFAARVKRLNIYDRDDENIDYIAKKVAELGSDQPTKPITCNECNKRYTTDCALWYGTLGDRQYFREHGGGFSCSWAALSVERLTKGRLDGLSASITTIDELHEIKDHEGDD